MNDTLGLSTQQKNLYFLLTAVGPVSSLDIMRLALISQSEWMDNEYYFGRNGHVPFSRELIQDLDKLEFINLITYQKGLWTVNDYLASLSTPDKYSILTMIQNFSRHHNKVYILELASFFKLATLNKGEKISPQRGFAAQVLSRLS